jgi:hypothetical protein
VHPIQLCLNVRSSLVEFFSEDQDFLVEAKRYQMEGLPFPGVIFARQRIVSIGDCVRDLELIMSAGSPEDLANSVQYLPL